MTIGEHLEKQGYQNGWLTLNTIKGGAKIGLQL